MSRHISICADTLKEQQTNLGTDEEALRADAETEYEADLIAIQENSSIKISRENFTVQGKRPQPCCRTAREFDAAMWNFIRKICADIFLDCYNFYKDIDVYSSLDDRSINEPDEPGSAELTPPRLRGADASFYGASDFCGFSKVKDYLRISVI